MSSPKMTRMFGLRPGEVDAVAGAAFCACANASEVSEAAAMIDDVPSSTLRRLTVCASSLFERGSVALSFVSRLIRRSCVERLLLKVLRLRDPISLSSRRRTAPLIWLKASAGGVEPLRQRARRLGAGRLPL